MRGRNQSGGGGNPRSRDTDVFRTPDVLENEFVTTITVTTLLLTAALSLAAAINTDDLEDFCGESCITRDGIYVNLYLSVWASGAGFFAAFIIYIAFKVKGILPTDVDVANVFFERFMNEIAASYLLSILGMMFLFAAICFYFAFIYPTVFISFGNALGTIYCLSFGPYIYYLYVY